MTASGKVNDKKLRFSGYAYINWARYVCMQAPFWLSFTVETEMSFWRNCRQWLHRKVSKWRLLVRSMAKILPKWLFSVLARVARQCIMRHGPLARYVKLRLCMCRECRERFSWRTCRDACRDRQLVVSFEVGSGENVLGIPGACATLNFPDLVRGPWLQLARNNSNERRFLYCHVKTEATLRLFQTWNLISRSFSYC